MNLKMERAHLAIAEKAVAVGEQHILDQERRVAELDWDGHDTKRALATLANFRRMQAEHVAHRNLLLHMLQQDAARPALPDGPIFRPGHYPQQDPSGPDKA